jgi:hypothetical protein
VLRAAVTVRECLQVAHSPGPIQIINARALNSLWNELWIP